MTAQLSHAKPRGFKLLESLMSESEIKTTVPEVFCSVEIVCFLLKIISSYVNVWCIENYTLPRMS